jgi:C4-dicarboxylate-specific signal transduction histidine kinase
MANIRVRARAVDMLGRQQIAGIPTAIHELLKNAHDAYAETVEVDYYRSDSLLIIRDDGIGMTREDFESRWLTLGTDSKVGANASGAQSWTGPRGGPARPIMGEKGIGRLAIAAIGPQVLVLSRAIRPDGLHPLVVSLVNWRVFEVPGIDLDSVEIPVVEMPGGDLPDEELLTVLTSQISSNLETLGSLIPPAQAKAILQDLSHLNFSPGQLQRHFPAPHLGGDQFGTHFYIRPSAPILAEDIDASTDDAASPLQKMLLGFSNTMMPGREAPRIQTRFRDHKEDGRVEELIGDSVFFTPEEFLDADHHVDGDFDAFGQFSGSVSVYRQPPIEHIIQWSGSAGRQTDCGPFRIKFAYVQGRSTESRLPPDEWSRISQKLNRIGGLYVYRDGIRILPYGNSDFDFLNIERRRTKSASDWFFSYRRIFGAVEISHSSNSNLVEKAGREGFRANKAYRELVTILENFFQRLAIDFFRPTGALSDDFNAIKQSLIRDAELLAKRERQVRERRKEFSSQLAGFFAAIEKGRPSADASELLGDLRSRLAVINSISDGELAARTLLNLEAEARTQSSQVRERYTITRPRSFGMTKTQQRDWSAYLRNLEQLEMEVFRPLEQSIDKLISTSATGTLATVDRRRRLVSGLEFKKQVATTASSRLRREVSVQAKELSVAVRVALKESIGRLTSDIEKVFVDLGRTDTRHVDDTALRSLQTSWESRIDHSASETRDQLERLRDELVTIAEAVASNESVIETTALLESRAEALREQLDSYSELAQVGMALGIVQHEFSSTVSAINRAIAKLQPWGTSNSGLDGLIKDVRSGFNHLEAYLRLFAPMSRRLNRDLVELTGEQIRLYLDEVFGDRLARHRIALQHTREFDEAKVRGYASTFLPAFVNVVDNALFWITFDRDSERWIKLDSHQGAFLISNGGPGIESRDADRIFEFGETNKPAGRGMGLYISRQVLNREGWDLTLEGVGRTSKPLFRIGPRSIVEGKGERDGAEELLQ